MKKKTLVIFGALYYDAQDESIVTKQSPKTGINMTLIHYPIAQSF